MKNAPAKPAAAHNPEVTQLLHQWRAGDAAALNALIASLYEPLQRIAAARIRHERQGAVSVDPSALLHEAYLKLFSGVDVNWVDRKHFLALSSNVMRQILVDQARKRAADKRACATMLSLDDIDIPDERHTTDLIDLHECIEQLAKIDERKAKVIELHAFAGLTLDEIATFLQVSIATVERDLRTARAWLYRELYGS
jgi:RNA polymerase sigma-70 factor, ECF subfamily